MTNNLKASHEPSKYLFIDFDGVVNALSRQAASESWEDIRQDRLLGYPIHYAPELVQGIEQMAAEGVNVVWLTTWCEESVGFAKLGFDAHPYLGEQARITHGRTWWKWDELQKFLADKASDTLIGWCDDDMFEVATYDPSLREFLEGPSVLGICPFSRFGLTPEHVEQLRDHFGLEV